MWCLALFAGALALRLVHLGSWSFWADEIFTLRDAARFPGSLPINPIPYVFITPMVKLFGEAEWSARLAPALVGAGSVPLVQWMGRRLLGTWTGRIAALFVALSPWHLFWSQNARHYTFAFFFAVLAACAFHIALEEHRRRWILVSLGATVCLILSHLPAAALVFGLAGYSAARCAPRAMDARPGGWRLVVAAYFAPFAVGGLVLLVVPVLREHLVSGWGLRPWARSPLYVLLTFVHGVTVPVAVAAVWSRWQSASPGGGHARLYLWCCSGIPVLLLVGLSTVQSVAGYYLFFASPFVFLLAADVCVRCFEPGPTSGRLWRWRWLPLTALTVGLVGGTGLYFVVEQGGRPDWKGALAELSQHASDGDLVVLSYPEIGQHYIPESGVVWEKIGLERVREPDRLMDGRPADGRMFVVVDMKTLSAIDPGDGLRVWLGEHGRRIARRTVFARRSDRTVEVYRLEGPAQTSSRKTESP